MAVRVPQIGSSFSPDTSRHTSSDISYVGRTLAEIDVIDGSQSVGETFSDGDDGVVRGGARGDLGQGRFDDTGVPGEQGLRDEDRPDVLSGSRGRFRRKSLELGGSHLQGDLQALLLCDRVCLASHTRIR
jgi:hypothetical protein